MQSLAPKKSNSSSPPILRAAALHLREPSLSDSERALSENLLLLLRLWPCSGTRPGRSALPCGYARRQKTSAMNEYEYEYEYEYEFEYDYEYEYEHKYK